MRRPARPARAGRRTVAYLHDNVDFGGIETLQLEVLRHLDTDRYRPVVIIAEYATSKGSTFAREVAALGVEVFHLPPPTERSRIHEARTCWNVARMLRRLRADVAHIQTRTPNSSRQFTVAAGAARVPGVVRTEHISPWPLGRSRAILLRPLDWMTDVVITDSKTDRQHQIDIVGRPASKVMASYCGIDPHPFDPDHDVAAAKRRLGLDPAAMVIGTVGRLHEQKGHRYLIDAFAKLVANHSEPLTLLLVGDGPDNQALRHQAAELGVADHIWFAGFQADALPYMHAMDVVVMPSLWEGFSISMQEFMALGKAMVVSDHHSFQEAMVDGEHGLIVPMRDSAALTVAIDGLLDDEARRRSLGVAAAARARREFSIERHVAELMDVYDRVLATRRVVP